MRLRARACAGGGCVGAVAVWMARVGNRSRPPHFPRISAFPGATVLEFPLDGNQGGISGVVFAVEAGRWDVVQASDSCPAPRLHSPCSQPALHASAANFSELTGRTASPGMRRGPAVRARRIITHVWMRTFTPEAPVSAWLPACVARQERNPRTGRSAQANRTCMYYIFGRSALRPGACVC